ncbi:hypothetical protein BC828DRAFT_270577 [Blastocladiella britannica]|nr:hypothetical protein BC828DRAFT_270577 [Blastocladiella britannica]
MIADQILACSAQRLTHGIPRAKAMHLVDGSMLRSLLDVAGSAACPSTARAVALLLRHCTLAAAAGQARTDILDLRWRVSAVGLNAELATDPRSPLVAASAGGHNDVAQWLLEKVYRVAPSHRRLDPSELAHAMGSASEHGQLKMLDWWWTMLETIPPFQDAAATIRNLLLEHDALMLLPAARGGNVAVLQWWANHCHNTNENENGNDGDTNWTLLSRPAIPKAMAAAGRSDALAWWYTTCASHVPAESPYTWTLPHLREFLAAAPPALLRAQLDAFEGPDPRAVMAPDSFDREVLSALTARGHADELAWWAAARGLLYRTAQLVDLAPTTHWRATPATAEWWWARISSVAAGRKAFAHLPTWTAIEGRVDLLDWAESRGLIDARRLTDDAWTLAQVVSGGDLGVMRWLHVRRVRVPVKAAWLHAASGRGHVAALNWLARTLEWPFPCAGARALDAASQLGQLAVLDWWVQAASDPSLPTGRVTLDYSHEAMDKAADVTVLHWWTHRSGLPLLYTENVIANASKSGTIDMLAWFRASGLTLPPFPPSYDVLASLVHDKDLSTLDWWWGSGMLLSVTSTLYEARRAQVQQMLQEPVNETDHSGVSLRVLQWWQEFIFGDWPPAMLRVVQVADQTAPTPPLKTLFSRLLRALSNE